MSGKTINHILKSNSDGELLDIDVQNVVPTPTVYPRESTLKRTFTLPIQRCIRRKNNLKPVAEENLNGTRPSFIRKVLKLVRRVSFIVPKPEFESRGCSQNDVRSTALKLIPGDKVPGVTGLRNHGNTCFINAVLQCLTHTDCLAEYFVMNQYLKDMAQRNKLRKKLMSKKFDTDNGELTKQLAILLKAVWHCQYNPDISNQFKVIIDKYGSQYRGNNQHDAQEFLIWLLDKVHEDLNTATEKSYKPNKSSLDRPDHEVARETLANHRRCNYSFVHELFQAQFRSSLTCGQCRKQSNTFDPFLCVSVPIPQQQKRPLYVTVIYLSQQPRQVKLGLSLPTHGTVKDLREQLSSDTGIPEDLILLTQIDDLGFQRTLSGSQLLAEIRDVDPLYCIEMPAVKEAEDLEKCIILCWVNVLTLDDHCSKFGSPFTMQLCRLTDYADLQKLLMKEMSNMLHDEVLVSEQDIPLFRMKIVDGVSSIDVPPAYLDPTVDHPLYMEEVDQALILQDSDSGPRHLKLVLEWDLQAKESIIAEDTDIVEEHASVKLVQGTSEVGTEVTLEECLDLYTREENLGGDDKWHCPFCNRKQSVTKKLGLWSLPDILVLHLKRFRQNKQRAATKLTTLVKCPLYNLNMKSHLVGPAVDASPPNSLLSPLWKRNTIPAQHGDKHIYDLYAVCNHHGSDVQGGHYTALCRNPYDGQWYSFDDTKVEPVPETDIISPSAYILFYQRRGTTSQSSSAASSTSSGSNSDHWVTRMPEFRAPNPEPIVADKNATAPAPNNNNNNNNNNSSNNNKNINAAETNDINATVADSTGITSPRPQRKAATNDKKTTASVETINSVADMEVSETNDVEKESSLSNISPNQQTVNKEDTANTIKKDGMQR